MVHRLVDSCEARPDPSSDPAPNRFAPAVMAIGSDQSMGTSDPKKWQILTSRVETLDIVLIVMNMAGPREIDPMNRECFFPVLGSQSCKRRNLVVRCCMRAMRPSLPQSCLLLPASFLLPRQSCPPANAETLIHRSPIRHHIRSYASDTSPSLPVTFPHASC